MTVETRPEPPSRAHRRNMANSRGTRPNLPARRPSRPGGKHAEVQCPCGAWRPSFLISETALGWMGDCCLSKALREGREEELG